MQTTAQVSSEDNVNEKHDVVVSVASERFTRSCCYTVTVVTLLHTV